MRVRWLIGGDGDCRPVGPGRDRGGRPPANSGSFLLTVHRMTPPYAPTFTGNGLLGIGSPPPAGLRRGTVPAQSELAGFYAKPAKAPTASERVQQRANIPTWSALPSPTGTTFTPRRGHLSRWKQSLDLHTGVITTRARWTAPDRHVTDITYRVFTDRGREHVGVVSAAAEAAMERHGHGHRRARRHGRPDHQRQAAAGPHPPGHQELGPGQPTDRGDDPGDGHRHRRRARRAAGAERQHHRAEHARRPRRQPECRAARRFAVRPASATR